MIKFMLGMMVILTSDLFFHFFGLAFVVAAGLLLHSCFSYKGG